MGDGRLTSIKCPHCGHVADAGTDTIIQGGFPWLCDGCDNEWEVRTAFFKKRREFDTDQFRGVLADAMEAQNITQTTIAELVGVTGAYISHIVHGKRIPTLPMARRILEVLGEHDAADAL